MALKPNGFSIFLSRGYAVATSPSLDEYRIVADENESALLIFRGPDGSDQFGIQLNEDGTFTFGGWNDDGEWIELKLAAELDSGWLYPWIA